MRGSTDIRRHRDAGTRWILISVIILALVACAIPLYRAGAATPSSGTLAPTDTAHVMWDGFPATATAPNGEASCVEGENCDTFTLTLTGQPADWAGKKVLVKISWMSPGSDYDLYVHKGSATGPEVDHDGASPPTTSETVTIDPTVDGTGVFAVHVVYFATTAADPYHGDASVFAAAVTPTPKPATQASGVKPRYQNHTPTEAQLATGKGTDAGEPTIGSNWKTGRAMYQSYLTTFRVTFNDACPSTPSDVWEDKSAPTSANSLDPLLWTANRTGAAPNRTIVSQLSGTTSLSSYTDDDGETWIPSQGGSGASGVDHQGIGGGLYRAPVPALVYPNAIYYCSQSVADANCARSDDGGQTYGPPVPIYNIDECAGLHGHPKVAPDGTVYVPNSNCISDGLLSYTRQAVIVSEDNGLTWAIRTIPNSLPGDSDPSLEIGRSGRVYFGYTNDNRQATVAVSDTRGNSWKNISDVGAIHGIKTSAFPAVVAGDNDRAAMAFFGSKTAGNPNDVFFPGFWHLYIAHTYDGGLTWTTVDATPNDPIQRGGIWLGGGSPIHRNLLDFFDATIDAKGRVLVGYDDGCYGGTCMQAPDTSTGNSYTQIAVIARQTGGRRMFAAFDPPTTPLVPGAPFLTTFRDGARVRLEWSQSDDGGSPITGYKIFRSSGGTETLLRRVGKVTSYEDIVPDKTQTYDYRVVAINAVGESCGDNTKSAPPLGGACTSYIVDVDPTGDQKSAPANPDLDIQTVSVSEPSFGSVHKLTFQMKVADLHTLVPDRQWRILWNYPVGPGGDADSSFGGRYYVGMNTDNAGQVSFEYGIVTNIDASPASTQQPMTLGPAEAGSNYTPDGMITIVISNSKVGNPAKGDLLGTVSGRTFAGNGDVTVRPTAAIDVTAPYSTPNFATYMLNGNVCVDLVLDKTQSTATGTVHVNQNLTYTVRVKNRGTTPATNVVMTDMLPASMTFVSATPTQGSCTRAGTTVTCNLGSMAGKSQATVNILVKPQTPGQFRNFASVKSKEDDQNPASNSDYVTTRVVK
ncbi:MAG TPA: hypothetical protein VF708_12530 [Pyrinomonadaceae bacterium]|jgi:uncharacterized repeat protein (TIGR01451 family)